MLTTDTNAVCQPGYTKKVRHTSSQLKHRIYVEYGIDRRGGHYEIDHLIPLELGGTDVAENLWPESFDTEPWNAHAKDQLENFLHAEVCAGRIPIEQAQREIAADWIAAYRRYLGKLTLDHVATWGPDRAKETLRALCREPIGLWCR